MGKNKLWTTTTTAIRDRIEQVGFTNAERSKAYKLVTIIMNNAEEEKEHVGYFGYTPLPYNYLVKVFTSRYTTFLDKLKREGIVEVLRSSWDGRQKEYYREGQAKCYRINPTLLQPSWTSVVYEVAANGANSPYLTINRQRWSKSVVFEDLAGLTVNVSKLTSATQQKCLSVTAESFKINEAITASSFWVEDRFTGFEDYGNKETSILIARERGGALIQDENRFIIAPLERFIEEKRANLQLSYSRTITALQHGLYYANRNPTNRRLDHNLTSCSKTLLEVIKEDNDLVEIDVANCQFALLAHLMAQDKKFKKTADFNEFYEVASGGKLYEHLQDSFGLGSRDAAKQMMMELAFCSHRFHNSYKKKLKEHFPTVVHYVDKYKGEKVKKLGKEGYKQFAIMLQKTEAKYFIDGLYYRLKKEGCFLLTKHDSLLVKQRDAAAVRSIMQDYFNSVTFHCHLK